MLKYTPPVKPRFYLFRSKMSLLRCCVSQAACLRRAGLRYLSTGPTVLAPRYTDKHEWADRAAAGDPATSTIVRVGISRYAASTLGDVVYVALPEPGETCLLYTSPSPRDS